MLKRPRLSRFSGDLTAFLMEGGIFISLFLNKRLNRLKTPLNAVMLIKHISKETLLAIVLDLNTRLKGY